MAGEASHHKRFQIDRIALFSDAVFAIAITLLIIEIKVPAIRRPVTDALLWEGIEEIMPEFIGFFISFYVISLYWLVHHRMFGYVTGYNRKLLVNNLFFMLSIVLMPFSSAFYSDYFITDTRLPMAVYVGNIIFCGWMSYRLWKIIAHPANKLSEGLENKIKLRYFLQRSLLVPGIFTFVLLTSFLFGNWANFATVLIPLVNIILNRYYRKKHPEVLTD